MNQRFIPITIILFLCLFINIGNGGKPIKHTMPINKNTINNKFNRGTDDVLVQPPTLPMNTTTIPPYVDMSPGGREGVHGWLWLPTNDCNENFPTDVARGYWVHHTPEFYWFSPHDFQYVIFGEVDLGVNLPFLPFAQNNSMVVNEFTFTPPYNFSLNDLIENRGVLLQGNFFNGSFDTTYERITLSSDGMMTSKTPELITCHYLNSTDLPNYEYMPYLSYPRMEMNSCKNHSSDDDEFGDDDILDVYLLHLVYSNKDFDQYIHGSLNLSSCFLTNMGGPLELNQTILMEETQSMGATWMINGLLNNIENRLQPSNATITLSLQSNYINSLNDNGENNYEYFCHLIVLEEIHCVYVTEDGLDQTRCDGKPEPP